LVVALALTGCASGPALVKSPPPATTRPEAAPRPNPEKWPAETTGIASWYGKAHHGRPTASGEIYDMHALTAAHRSLPLGTRVLVTNVKNDRSVEVRINDRGPYIPGRIIDLSYAAARELRAIADGIVRVKLRILEAASAGPSPTTGTTPGTPTAASIPVSAPARRRARPPRFRRRAPRP
jgi:rare lipoprotein A